MRQQSGSVRGIQLGPTVAADLEMETDWHKWQTIRSLFNIGYNSRCKGPFGKENVIEHAGIYESTRVLILFGHHTWIGIENRQVQSFNSAAIKPIDTTRFRNHKRPMWLARMSVVIIRLQKNTSNCQWLSGENGCSSVKWSKLKLRRKASDGVLRLFTNTTLQVPTING